MFRKHVELSDRISQTDVLVDLMAISLPYPSCKQIIGAMFTLDPDPPSCKGALLVLDGKGYRERSLKQANSCKSGGVHRMR